MLFWGVHIFMCALYVAVIGSLVDFLDVPVASLADVLVTGAHWTAVLLALFVCLLLLSAMGKWVFTLIYALLCLVASCLAYFRYTIHFSFNTMILDVVFQNDVAVSADMVTPWLVVWLLLSTTFGAWLAFFRRKYSLRHSPVFAGAVLFFAALACGVFFSPSGRFMRPICARIPFVFFQVTHQYLQQKTEIQTIRPRQCTYAHCMSNDSCVVVVVIGEAVRPANLSINGYARKTTPNIEKWQVVSLDSVFSDYVYTNKSVPHLLSRATTQYPNRAYTERSFIDVYKAAGIPTASIFNQDAERPYAYFINESDTVIACNQSKTVYNFTKWLDQDILPHYNRLLDKYPQQLILIHTIGSHWWYNAHYREDFEVFKPVMKSRNIALCDSMEVVNAYDNTVLYSDFVWGELIQSLQNKTAILLYLSDHGEALGEEGVWLHASELPIMHHTAAFVWMSDAYKQKYPHKYQQLLQNKHKRLKTDFLYHAVIDAGGIQTDVLDSTLTIF